MKYLISRNILTVALLFFLTSFFLNNSLSYLDPDLGWHLKAGEFVFLNHDVPRAEINDYTLEGKTWVDHEWLINYLSFIIERHSGYVALNIFFALIVVLIIVALNLFLLKNFIKEKVQIAFLLFLEIVGFMGCLPHLGLRMQEFTVLFWVLLFIILHRFAYGGKSRSLFFLPLLFYVWANIHAGFLLGLPVLWVFLGYQSLGPKLARLLREKPFFNKFEYLFIERDKVRLLLVFSFLSTLVTCVTPYFLEYYAYLFKWSNTFYLSRIVEWLPTWSAPIIYGQFIYLIVFSTGLILFFADKKKKSADFWYFCAAIFMFILAFKSKRHFPLFFIASLPFLLESSASSWLEWRPDFKILRDNLPLKIILTVSLLLSGAIILLRANYASQPFSNVRFCEDNPCGATDFLRKNPGIMEGNLFNPYNWGGYLIHELPDKKLFIDGRLPMFELAGHTIMEEYYDFFSEGKAEEKLNQYGIKLVMLEKPKTRRINWFEKYFLGWSLPDKGKTKDYLLDYLESSASWKKAYEDKISLIYRRL